MVTWKSSASLPAGTPVLIPSKSASKSGLEFRTWQSSGGMIGYGKADILPVGQALSLLNARQGGGFEFYGGFAS